jgi:hypothetical protein
MNTNDLIIYVSETTRSLDLMNKEIRFWRKKFLDDIQEKDSLIRNGFLNSPCESMCICEPIKYLRALQTNET